MQVVIAVIDDLYRFAVYAVASVFEFLIRQEERQVRTTYVLPDARMPGANPPAVPEGYDAEMGEQMVEPPSAFKSVAEVVDGVNAGKPTAPVSDERSSTGSTVMYVGGAETPLFREPTVMFDSVVTRLPYGAMVMVLEQKGRWAKVAANDSIGWIEREELVDRAAHVYPHFEKGQPNDADDLSTIRVRAIIGDEFSGGRAGLPLQAGEYVLYRLTRKGITVSWPDVRPRNAGRWHEILRGIPGISMGITPRSGAVMEYVTGDVLGHLAYVEAVFPDESINISEANVPDSGIYSERSLTKDEWKELRPVFIIIS